MSVKQDVVNLLVNINGDSAKNKLNDLRKSAADLREAMKGMKKGSDDYIAASAKLSGVKQDMEALKKQIGITALSQRELNAELRRLNALKSAVAPFSKEFNQLQTQINAVKGRLTEVRSGAEGFRGVLAQMVPEVRGFGAVMLAAFAFQAIRRNITSFIKDLASMSNQLSDIQRVTGMTKIQVDNLDKSLKSLDTGTSVNQLRDLAIVAGKLGVANKDILSFVEATDKLVVALGDELGDADAITTNLGKIINVFDSEGGITGDKLLHIGNAIVDLANKGVATGGFIVDFTQRLSGMAKAAGVALPAVIGLAAGFEESGLRVESSATALQNLLGIMGKNVEQFAKVAGKDLDAFAKTVRDNPVEALIELAQGAIKNKQGFAELAPVFKELEANGIRVQQVLATLGTKGDFFREKIEEAGASLQQTGEITEAFALKNDNLSTNLSKLGKEFSNGIKTSGMVDFFNEVTKSILGFVKSIKEAPEWLERNKQGITLLIVGVTLLNGAYIKSALSIIRETAAKALNLVGTKALAIGNNVATAATAAYTIVVNLLTGKITAATAATRLFSVATKGALAMIGGLIAIIGTGVIVYQEFKKSMDGTIAAQKAQLDITKAVNEATADQKEKINNLVNAVNNHNLSLEQRKKALQALISQSPDYLSGLTLENSTTQQGINIINEYIKSLDRLATAKALVDIKADLSKQLIQKDAEVEANKQAADQEGFATRFFLGPLGLSDFGAYTKSLKDYNTTGSEFLIINRKIDENVKTLNGDIAKQQALMKSLKEGTKEYNNAQRDLKALQTERNTYLGIQDVMAGKNDATQPSGGSATPSGTPSKSDVNRAKKLKEESRAFALEMKDLQAKLIASGRSVNEEEIVAVEQKYAKLLQKAKKYGFDILTINKMEQEELQQLFEKHFQKRSEDEYTQSLKNSKDYYNQKRDAANKDFTDGITTEKEYNQQISKIAEDEKKQKSVIAKEYTQTSKKAAADQVQMEREASEEKVNNKKQENQNKLKSDRQAARESLTIAQSQVGVAELTLPKGSKGILEARKNLIEQQFQMDVEGKLKSDAIYVQLEKEKNETIKQLELESFQDRFANVMQYVDMFSQAMGSVFDFMNAKDDAALAKDKKANDAKKNNLQKQLDQKLISQSVFDKKTQEIQDEQDKKEKEVAKKKAEREKAKSLFDIAINTASAIVEALPNIGLSIAVGVLGAIQAAAVAATPIPEMGTGGLLKNGPKHRDQQKGLKVVNPDTGNTEMLLERGEGVVSAAAMDSGKIYTLRGTTAQITSTLNGMAGGATWASNATFIPAWQKSPQPQINPQMVKMMAGGGLINSQASNNPEGNSSSSADSAGSYNNQDLIAEVRGLRGDIAKQSSTLKAYVTIKDIDKQRALYEQAQKAGGINQE